MKPRTKLQLQIVNLSRNLPVLSARQREWGLKHCLDHVAYRTKKQTACLDCGHIWSSTPKTKTCTCPTCGVKLKITDTLKKKMDQRRFLGLLDVVQDFQVVRIIEIKSYHKAGYAPKIYTREVVQQFFQPEMDMVVVARNKGNMGSGDSFHGDMEIRSTKGWYGNKFDLWPDMIFPKIKCLPEYQRNGYKSAVQGLSPFQVFKSIITDNISETLIKVKQYGLLEARLGSKRWEVSKHWDSVKICIRNKYIIKAENVIIWLDYMDLLKYFRKDRRNQKYVCPNDLKKDHDRLVKRKLIEERRRTIEEQSKKISRNQEEYAKAKGAFFGLVFTSGSLSIKVLEHVEEFLLEGLTHKHCVFANAYYGKEDSLVFSAKVNGQPAETIEVSISDLKITQSRGLHNKASEYNQQIIDLVNKNMSAIAGRCKELRREVA